MEFKFETAYDQKAVTIMAKVLRKTARKKRSRRSRVFGIIVVILAILLALPLGDETTVFEFKTVVTWGVVAVLVLVLIFEDQINGYIARKRMLPGLDKAVATFTADGYHSETPLGSSQFLYENITSLAETDEYFVFLFGKNHAQIYDKRSISGGTIEEFREFISNIIGKEIEKV